MPVCSIIILTYNSQSDIRDCLKSVLNQSFEDEYEVVVADNDSTDRTAEIVAEEFPTVNLVEFDRNWGTAKGYNKAFEHTQGDYVVYLNPDTVVQYEWLEKLQQTLIETQSAAAHSCIFEPYHAEFNGLNRHSDPDRRIVFELTSWGFVEDHHTGTEPQETLFLSATSMMIRRQVAENLDELFDSDLPMYGDDLDLSLRLALLGYRIVHAPDSIVYHRQYQKNTLTAPRWLLKKYVWLTTSRYHAFYKTMTNREYIFMLPRLLMASIANVKILRIPFWKKGPLYIVTVLLSLFSLLYSLLRNRQYAEKRQRLAQKRKNSVYKQLVEKVRQC